MHFSLRYAILTLGFVFTIPCHAKTIFVDDNASAGGVGTSWASAHKYLQDALAGAEYGDEIWIAEGTYKPDQGAGKTAGDRASPFVLVNGVGMYGGFLGTESIRDPQGDNNQTILSGEIDSNSSLWSFNVVSGVNLDTNTILDGFRITKGNANGQAGTVYEKGGGIYLAGTGSNLNLSNLVITSNSADIAGGGIYSSSSSSSLTLANCVFTNNSAGNGGGICFHSSLTLTNCLFTSNSAGNNGGGIYSSSSSSSLTLANCVFTNNSVGNAGGGVYSKSSSHSTLTNCVFKNNSAVADGGGLHSKATPSTLTNCAFTNNSAGRSGGGIYSHSSPSTLTNCLFTSNSAGNNGGGISSYSPLSLTNSLFTSNSAGNGGGGVHLHSATPSTLTNCLFTSNSAGNNGGGIWSSATFASSWTLANCILWKNTSNSIEGHGFSSSGPWISHVLEEAVQAAYPGDPNAQEIVYQPNLNILQGWEGDARAFAADPLFVNIDNPIGPDGIWFTEDDGLRLQVGSPAIDAGYNDTIGADIGDIDNDGNNTEKIPIDLLGVSRIQSGTVDIGAYEGTKSGPFYLVSVFLHPQNSGSVDSGVIKIESGYSSLVTATPSTGYHFSHWSGDASGSTNPLDVTVNANMNITANFVLTHTIYTSSSSGGSVTGSGDFTYGSSTQLSATPSTGYQFSHWSGDASGSTNPLDVTVKSNMSITAHFVEKCNLNLKCNHDYFGEITGGKPSLINNESIQLTAAPKNGYSFGFWSGDISSIANPITIKGVGKEMNVQANFFFKVSGEIKIKNARAAYENEQGYVNMVFSKDSFKLIAIPKDNYIFSYWEYYEPITVEEIIAQVPRAPASNSEARTTEQIMEQMPELIPDQVISGNPLPLVFRLGIDPNPPNISAIFKKAGMEFSDLGNNWKQSDWFGYLYDPGSNWYYHSEFGWLYIHAFESTNLWVYFENIGWRWTNNSNFPYFYDSVEQAWMYFQSDNGKTKFYRYDTNTWVAVE